MARSGSLAPSTLICRRPRARCTTSVCRSASATSLAETNRPTGGDMPFQRHHGLRALLAAAFAPVALGLAACEQDAVTDVTGEKPVLNILLAPGAAVLPGGTSALSGTRISNFDTSVP